MNAKLSSGARLRWRAQAVQVLLLASLACICRPASALEPEDVSIPWKAGRVQQFSDETASGDLTAKLFKAAAAPTPFVVFMHGCGGLKLDTVGHWAEFLTKRGVGVLMVDSLGPRNRQDGCADANPQWIRRRADDAASALAWLRSQPYARQDRIALMGQSQGATAVMLAAQKQAASSREIVGTVAMYPGCAWGVNGKFQFERPFIVLVGDEDTWTPAAACTELKALQTGPSAMELIVYPGARHSFDNPGVYRMALGKYPVGEHAASRDKARERVQQFIEQHLR